jgi:nucleotide-binding universal stress UspA family protein
MPGTAIKTIAVHLPTAGVVDRLLDAALPLAREHDARLVGIHVVPAVIVYADATVSMSTEFIVAQQEAFREDAKAIEAAFRARADAASIASEWRIADTGDEPTMRATSTLANVADLVVASQYQDTIPAASGYTPDELVLGTGRPVLIVPGTGELSPVGRRALVAWNGSREASRAVYDCLALLRPDAELCLLTVDSSRGDSTLSSLAEALARHGLKVVAKTVSKSEGRATGEEILKQAADYRADLLALGCYGHSRLRETVFGGATTHVLRDMTLPVLMAH